MKISYNWLKQFINLELPAEDAGDLLTDLGLEVEGIEAFQSVKGALKGIVVGEVKTCKKHANADKLKVATVAVGTSEILQIVCGAPNVAEGQKVPVATIGTTLYDANGEPWTIKKGKIRGEVSEGMICAEDELGLGESHDGIMVLDKKLKIGTPLAEVFEVEDDHVFEIGLTPNRADAMSHWGVARDLRAGLLQKGTSLELITPSTTNFRIDNRTNKINVEVHSKELAPRYCGITISGIKVADSPLWLQNRLKAIGLKPKNNIVDVTNYVLHELGQPLHAFDIAKINGAKIEVKTVSQGTKFVTLDEIERELHEEDLMICDAEKPLCIAGVLGGMDSGVTASTNAIFLESAYFNPVSIRKTAKRHSINTDASFRFERGIDPNITDYALRYAAILIKEIAGGEITSDLTDIYPKKIQDFQVFLSFEKAKKIIGEEIPKEIIKRILTSLEIKVNNVTESGLGLTIPAYRNDVTREVDVVEEILRVYGYNNINFSQKLNASISKNNKIEDYHIQNVVAALLNGNGFSEMMANSLTTPKYSTLLEDLNISENVTILNPLSQELSVMRRRLVFSALEAVSYNSNRKRHDLKLFEFGKTYHNIDHKNVEKKHLSITITGNKSKFSWNNPQASSDFFYLKGMVELLLSRLGITVQQSETISDTTFSEGLSYTVKGNEIVRFGLLKRVLLKHFDLEETVLYADFNWDNVLTLIGKQKMVLQDIPKYPEVKRDLALLLLEDISFKQIYDIATRTEKKLLKDVSLFDVYTGKNLPEGKKSYAVSFTLQDENKTLTDSQVEKIMKKLEDNFRNEIGAELR